MPIKTLTASATALGEGNLWGLAVAHFLVSVYGGFFGAGMGILMLAELGFVGLTNLHQMNGLKNFGAAFINLSAAVTFIVGGLVFWRLAALMAYRSQFTDQKAGSEIFPAQKEIRARVESMGRFYGMMGGVTYAEPFVQKEVGLVDDVMALPVKSI